MMEDLHDSVIQFLVSQGYKAEALSDSDTAFSVALSIDGIDITIECDLPEFFPYEFPIVRLSEESIQQCEGIPHRIRGNSLCLFNSADAFPNFLNPQQLALSTIKKAETILHEGFSGKNQDDFENEILEYWDNNNLFDIHLFSELESNLSKLYLVKTDGNKYIATNTKKETERLYRRITLDDSPVHFEYGLYIPLSKGFSAHEVNSEKKMWSAVRKRISPQEKKCIDIEISKIGTHKHIIIVSFLDKNDERVYLTWRGCPITRVDGFRAGHISPFLFWNLQKDNGSKMCKGKVSLCVQSRLYRRGSFGYEYRLRSAAVVGCGSVGSHLCALLASMGTEQYLLVDDEKLSIDNIARHVCGYNSVGISKAHALKWYLEAGNPNVTCEALYKNAFDVVQRCAPQINDCDALFLSVGELPLEAFVLELGRQEAISVPTIITWVEPMCYAAHMVYVSQYNYPIEELLNLDTMRYKYSVIDNSSDFIKHEAGCQSGYVPYSGLDIQNYLSESLHILSRLCAEQSTQGNYHLIWIGELSAARRNNAVINTDFSDVQDFSMIIKRFD